MTRKEFHFDFNEDADPVEELHRLRVAMTDHFKTVDAIIEYSRSLPTPEEMIAELKVKIAEKKLKKRANRRQARTIPSSKATVAKKVTGHRKTAKQLVHD